jgi:hypothetical protein
MIKTLATKITPENYPIAVACLPPGFALIKKELVMGAYLVINDLQFPDITDEGRHMADFDEEECEDSPPRPRRIRYGHPVPVPMRRGHQGLSLVNFWTPKKSFKKEWDVIGEVSDRKTQFFEVTRK